MNKATAEVDLMKVDELATRLRVPASWVYSHADSLGAYRVGKYLRFSWSRVIERLERNCDHIPDVRPSTQQPVPIETNVES